jgi:hypothetical protein
VNANPDPDPALKMNAIHVDRDPGNKFLKNVSKDK